MATIDEINVVISADASQLTASVAQAEASLGQIGSAATSAAGVVDKAAQRIADANGRIRDGFGKFVPAAQLAAEAAANVGGSLATVGTQASRTAATVNGELIASFRAFDKTIQPLNEGIGRFGEGLKSAGGTLTTAVTLPLTLLGGAAIKAAGDIQALEKGFAATYKGSEDLGTALAKVRELAKLPGLGLQEALQGATNLQAAGFSANLASRALGAFGNALATVGKGRADLDGVGLALGQIASKGKISAEEIGQLAERVPQIRKVLQDGFGTSDAQELQKLGVSATQFVEVVTTELEKLPKVSGGINNAFENIADSGTIALSKLGDALNRSFNVEGVLGDLSDFVAEAANKFAALDPGTQRLIFGFAGAAAAVGPLLFGLGAIVAAIPSVVAGLSALGIASTAALGPIGIAAAAVAAAAVLIIDNWDDIVSYFSTGEGSTVFSELAASVSNAVNEITSAFSALNGGGNFGDLVSATGILKAAFRDVAVGITAAANVIGGVVGALTNLLKGDFSAAADQASRALLGLAQPIANVLGFQLRLSESTKGVRGEFDALALTLPGLASSLNALGTPFPIANVVGTPEAFVRQIGLLAALKQELKNVQEQRDNETSVAAITADNARIISLQKQIAALEGTDKASKKAADAIAKLRQELGRLTALDNLLGDTPSEAEVLERRAGALEKGLKTLVDAGISPGSKAFRSFAADLVNTSQALDRLRGAGQSLDLKPVNVKSLIPQSIGDTLPQDVARLLGDYAKQAKPFELPVAVKLSIQSTVSLADQLKGALNAELLNIGKAFQQADAAGVAFGGTFDSAGQKAAALGQSIQALLAAGISPYSVEIQNLVQQQRALAFESQNTLLNIDTLKEGFAALGDSVGQSLGSAILGGDAATALAGVFGSLIDVIADYASKKGKLLIADGIADVLIPGTQALGALKIAAGTGLIVAAGVARAGAAAATGGAGGSSLASKPSTSYNTSATANNAQTQTIKLEIPEFRLRGQDLVTQRQVGEYRVLRTA